MEGQDRRARIACELFAAAVREEQLLRVDRGPEGRGETVDFRAKTVGAIAEACVRAADELIRALDRKPAT